ncbi:hypothetical protein C8Q78DRAFT_85598 [Trametes maxima]|nr:hypothetical protein C8Q78DRAFT_85598 [Trametes maxima]
MHCLRLWRDIGTPSLACLVSCCSLHLPLLYRPTSASVITPSHIGRGVCLSLLRLRWYCSGLFVGYTQPGVARVVMAAFLPRVRKAEWVSPDDRPGVRANGPFGQSGFSMRHGRR